MTSVAKAQSRECLYRSGPLRHPKPKSRLGDLNLRFLRFSLLQPRGMRLGNLRLGANAGGQTQNADEALRIFLIVACAHGERREVGAVERIFGLPTYYAYVAFVERKRR